MGVIYAGRSDRRVIRVQDGGALPHTVPTNIRYAVPAHYIASILSTIDANGQLPPESEAVDLKEMLANATYGDALDTPRFKQMPLAVDATAEN